VELEVAPGQVVAEVDDNGTWHALLRVPTFEEEQWQVVLAALTSRLDRLAPLLEGELDLDLAEAAEERGVPLFPAAGEVETDCDCGDWASPCAHAAALHHLVAEALDGDPLLLFTLRGRTRPQLLAELRRWYGDVGRGDTPVGVHAEPAPAGGDPLQLAAPLPPMSFRFGVPVHQAGLAELGPLEGDEGLDRILAPLYAAGAAAAAELALSQRPTERRRRRRPASAPPPPVAEPDPAEAVVDALAAAETGVTASEIGRRLGWTAARTRSELEGLEALGMVARTGRGARETWWLG
jgi:hypothetical protein